VPGVATENPLLFEVVQGLIHKHLIGHPADAQLWPVYEWLLDSGTRANWHSNLLTGEEVAQHEDEYLAIERVSFP
jgi:hypothetical protein